MSQQFTNMSDDQRRTLCRIVFLLVCVLPTATILYFMFHRPGAQQWERMVRAELGLPVKIESVETPTPTLTILRGVSLLPNSQSQNEPEQQSPQQLANRRIEELAIVFGEEKNQIIVMDSVELDPDSLTTLASELTRQLGKSLSINSNWRIRFKKVTLVDPEFNRPDFALQPVDMFVEPTQLKDQAGELQEAVHISMQAQAAEQSIDAGLLAEVWTTAEYTAVRLDTRNERLPMYLARSWQRHLDQLGAQCTFNGKLSLTFPNQDPSQLTGGIAGNLYNIQLDQITGVPGSGLRGSCDLHDFTCNLDQGRIDSAELQVTSNGAISIDRAWVNAISYFTGSNSEIGDEERVSHVNFGVCVQDGTVRISDPMQQFDSRPIPVDVIAMALTGELSQGTRSVAIMDLFKIPAERIARHPAGDNSLHR